jgi:hypothetical protein
MKPRIIIVVVLALLATLALPSASFGLTWKVKTRSGRVCGTVSAPAQFKLFQGDVKRRSGSWAGWVSSQDSGSGSAYALYRGKPGPVSGGGLGFIENGLLRRPSNTGPVLGKAVKSGGSWVIRKRVNGTFRTVGRVAGSCPRGYAVGAGRLLLW